MDVPLKNLFTDLTFFYGLVRPVTVNERIRHQGLSYMKSRMGLFLVTCVLFIILAMR